MNCDACVCLLAPETMVPSLCLSGQALASLCFVGATIGRHAGVLLRPVETVTVAHQAVPSS